MKKLYIIFLIHFFGFSFAQKVLNTTSSGGVVTDKVSITLQPGFNVKATANSTFSAFIDANENDFPDYVEATMPSLGENYVKTIECLDASCSKKKETVVYFDGLGREKQALQVGASPTGNTIVVPYEYDGFGRQAKEFLPFPISSASNKITTANGESFYTTATGDTTPFSEKTFENSPLNRVLKQAAPGATWKKDGGHEIEFQYATNIANEVLNFGVDNPTTTPTLVSNGSNYGVGTLYKTITIDENGQPIQEFKDKEGKVILKRIVTSDGPHDTYYVYDIYGNLTFVLPPKLIEAGSYSANLAELGYQYQYDDKNRLVEKQLPGKGREFMVYDNQDRLVASQDALQRQNGGYFSFTHYDKFGRIVAQGQHPESGVSRASLQAHLNNLGSNNVERTSSPYNHSGLDIFYTRAYGGDQANSIYTNINYYDNYQNLGITPSSIDGQTVIGTADIKTKGLAVASFTNVLGTTTWNKNYTYYDSNYIRPIASASTNYLGGYTNSASILDFIGKVLNTVTKHKPTSVGTEITINEGFGYYDNELLQYQTHQINNGAVEYVVQNSYNEINQLTSKKVGNTASTPLQTVDYKYNIRGWMTDINNIAEIPTGTYKDLFAFRINYDKIESNLSGFSPRFNGNIAQVKWKTQPDDNTREYLYSYDGLNRLTHALSYNGTYFKQVIGAYTENISYDKNGNIKNLYRTGGEEFGNIKVMDNLTYDYKPNSNQLNSVSDNAMSVPPGTALDLALGFNDGNKTGDDYVYDVNGNLRVDKNKGITNITYNFLNLPTEVLWSSTIKINYTYDASGVKLRKVVTDGATVTTTDYIGGFQYQNSYIKMGNNSYENYNHLQFFPTAEGYVNVDYYKSELADVPSRIEYNYVYNYTDHLGNVRLSYQKEADGTLKVLEENNYYPFGLKHQGYNNPLDIVFINGSRGSNNYKYKYNGKELQDELNLNLYDYGARNYDPAIGRWFNIDPLAEESRRFSPYAYALNNPVYFIDPDGMMAEEYGFQDNFENFKDFNTMNSFNNEFESKGFYYPSERGTTVGEEYSDADGAWVWDGDTWVGRNGTDDYVILDNDNVITPNKLEESDAYFTIPISIPIFEGIGAGTLGGLLRLAIGGSFGSMLILTGDRPRDRVVNIDDGLSHLSDEEVNSEYEKLKGNLSKEQKAYKQKLKTEQKYRQTRGSRAKKDKKGKK